MKTETAVTRISCTMCGTGFKFAGTAPNGLRCPRCKELLPLGEPKLDEKDIAVLSGRGGPSPLRKIVRIAGVLVLLTLLVVVGFRVRQHFVEKSNDVVAGNPNFAGNFKRELSSRLGRWRIDWVEQKQSHSLSVTAQLGSDNQIRCYCLFDFEADKATVNLTMGDFATGAKDLIASEFQGDKIVHTKTYNDPGNKTAYENAAKEVVLAVRDASRKCGLR